MASGGSGHSRAKPARVAGLDGIRGLAVILVVFSHAQIPWFGPGGIEGVTAFFTLSGFLITGLLIKEYRLSGRVDLIAFWLRRALRLLPALFAFVAIAGAIYVVMGWMDLSHFRDLSRAVVLYYSNFYRAFHGTLGPFSHTWSLAVEEQFYLVWPLLLTPTLVLAGRRRRAGQTVFVLAVLLTLVSVAWRLHPGTTPGHGAVFMLPHTTIFSMTAGACLAVVYERGWRLEHGALPLSLVGASAYFWFPLLRPQWAGWVIGPIFYTLITLVIIAAVSGTRWTPFALRPLRAIGTVSYGWYLWHYPFVLALMHHRVAHPTAATWMVILGTLGMAGLSWVYLEKPLQRRFRGRLERARLTAGPVAEAPAEGGGTPAPGEPPAGGPVAAPAVTVVDWVVRLPDSLPDRVVPAGVPGRETDAGA